MDKKQMDEIIRGLELVYGSGKGLKTYNVIMPGILSDFNNMLKKAPIGEEISEEYRLEDGKGVIRVKGHRKGNGDISTSISFTPF